MPNYGTEAARKINYALSRNACTVTLTRPATGATQTVNALVQSLTQEAITGYRAQGQLNTDDMASTLIIVGGSTDVRNGDKATYKGITYRIVRALPSYFNDVCIKINCLCGEE